MNTQANIYRLNRLESVKWPNLPKPLFHLVGTINKGLDGLEENFYVAIKKGKSKTPYLTRIYTDPRIVAFDEESQAREAIKFFCNKRTCKKIFQEGFIRVVKQF